MAPKRKQTKKKSAKPPPKPAKPAAKKATKKKPGAKGPAATKPAAKKSGQTTLLSDLAPDIVVSVLGFFRSVEHEGRDVLEAPDNWAGRWDDVSFVEEAATLANVVNFALCSKATRDVALGDGVWAPHLAAMEANLVVAPREWKDYVTDSTRVLPEEFVDPRALDPKGYASLSALKRYWAVRSFYEDIKETIEMDFGDEANWNRDDIRHLKSLAGFCATRVFERFEDDYGQWADLDGEMDDAQKEEVLERITESACARLTLKCFVLPEFSRGGVSGHARDLLLYGWPSCSPCAGSASTAEFLERLTGLEWPC